jgi:hypothetical protein
LENILGKSYLKTQCHHITFLNRPSVFELKITDCRYDDGDERVTRYYFFANDEDDIYRKLLLNDSHKTLDYIFSDIGFSYEQFFINETDYIYIQSAPLNYGSIDTSNLINDPEYKELIDKLDISHVFLQEFPQSIQIIKDEFGYYKFNGDQIKLKNRYIQETYKKILSISGYIYDLVAKLHNNQNISIDTILQNIQDEENEDEEEEDCEEEYEEYVNIKSNHKFTFEQLKHILTRKDEDIEIEINKLEIH